MNNDSFRFETLGLFNTDNPHQDSASDSTPNISSVTSLLFPDSGNRITDPEIIGDNLIKKRNYPLACFQYIRALSCAEDDLMKNSNDSEKIRLVCRLYCKLGYVSASLHDTAEAKEMFAKLHKLAKRLPTDISVQQLLSVSYYALGNIAWLMGDYPMAQKYYMDSAEIQMALAERVPHDPAILQALSSSFETLGNAAKELGDYRAASDYFLKTYKIRETHANQFPDVPLLQVDLASIYANLGDLATSLDDYGTASKWYSKALSICQRLAEQFPNDPEKMTALSTAYSNLGCLSLYSGDYGKANDYLMQAYKIIKDLTAKYPHDSQLRDKLGFSYACLGAVAKITDDHLMAQVYWEKSVKVFDRQLKLYPDNIFLMNRLATALLQRATCGADSNLSAKEKSMLKDAAALFTKIYKRTGYKEYAESAAEAKRLLKGS